MSDRNMEQKSFIEEFRNPPSKYRDVPFWAWNTKMTKEDVDFCLPVFKEMGMGGAFAHSRTGLDIPYLGEEYMALISYGQKKAEELGLCLWLYDEDRWPSGFGGGFVTRSQEYRSRFLVWSPRAYREGEQPENRKTGSTAEAVRSRNRKLLGVYRIESQDGYLTGYRRIDPDEAKQGEKEKHCWWAYLEVCGDNPWFNGQSYVDTLNPQAVKCFLNVTYERYRQVLGRDFGTKIPGIFTDEPQFTPKHRAGSIDGRREVILPFTDSLPGIFKESYGFDLLDRLPELFYEKKQGYSQARYGYHEVVSRLFAQSYSEQIGAWCQENDICLTGHLMKEPLLSSQTMYVGDVTRHYAGFQIPGIDMLCDRREFTTAKQAQSVAHQYGRKAMISELYGVTNWDYDFRGHKMQGDWQAALGVTMRAPHLAWTSMEGEAKRDYPASIFYQSPWYKQYRLIEDYFARISVVLSRGKAMVDIGVLHPIETCWLKWGTEEKTGEEIKELDSRFLQMTDWLLGNCLDFDFISEALLPGLYRGIDGECILVGEMGYRILVVPFMETIRSTTLDVLEQWKEAGGNLLFVAGVPEYVDGVRSDRALKLSRGCKAVEYSKCAVCGELSKYRQAELFYGEYERAEDLLCQVRKEDDKRYLFIAHKYNPGKKDCAEKKKLKIRMKGMWNCTFLNPMDGNAGFVGDGAEAERGEAYEEVHGIGEINTNGSTEWNLDFFDHDSVLLMLEPGNGNGETERRPGEGNGETEQKTGNGRGNGEAEQKLEESSPAWEEAQEREISVKSKWPVTLMEPNVLVLDMAQYAFEGQEWQHWEEILRIDNQLRRKLGYPLRMEAWPQPWTRNTDKGKNAAHPLILRYLVESEINGVPLTAAMEQMEETSVFWNGNAVDLKENGWYVDRRIKTAALGTLKRGQNELRIVRNFYEGANLEPVYLLGDFGVRVTGRRAVITEAVRELEFGDWTVQGLPFYGGNVTYHMDMAFQKGETEIEISRFAAPLLAVKVNGNEQGTIAFSPYRLNLGALEKERNHIDIIAFGNRINTFGALHNCDVTDNKAAPDYWRTEGMKWSYEYCLRPAGILKTPVVRVKEKRAAGKGGGVEENKEGRI